MPEGHTLHRLARLHTEYFAGGPVRVSSPQGRFTDHVAVDGRYFSHATAVGKHLFHHYEGGLAVHIHLGLYGFFDTHVVEAGQEPPAPVGQVRMRVGAVASADTADGAAGANDDTAGDTDAAADDADTADDDTAGDTADDDTAGDDRAGVVRRRGGPDRNVGDALFHVVDLRGPTRCEVIAEADVDGVRERLGPDPLDPAAEPDRAWQRIRRSSRTIGALLMDQKVLAGVGNVYRAEVLFRAGLDPFTPGNRMRDEDFRAMWDDLAAMMAVGADTGAIHTIRAAHDHGDLPRRGADRPRNYVYQRDSLDCRVCGTTVVVAAMENRSLYWCPGCQAS